MIAYISRRIILSIFTVWIISVLAFVIIQLPEGDAADRFLDRLMQVGVSGDLRIAQELRSYLGLDEPMYVRYGMWIWNIAHGDLGRSIATWGETLNSQKPVKEVIGDRLYLTVVLTGFTILVTWTFAIPVGIYSAVRQHSIGDYTFTFLGFTGLAVPDFLLGLVLMYLAFAYFDQSVGGLFSAKYINAPWTYPKVIDLINHLWIPAIVLGTSGTAGLIRVMRNNLLDELSKPYVVTGMAKGIKRYRLILKYPVRVAVNPLISTVGYLLPSLVGGSVIVSVVLSLPTLGPVLLDAILIEDTQLAGFIVLMLGVLTVVGTLISDILLAIVDPRIKLTVR
tara:strand:+ start:30 stop:1040 length:1011 start_codon:yes stop_codon:yes gene_type:complete